MNKSVRENCIPKCIMISLEKNPRRVDFFQAGLPECPLKARKRNVTGIIRRWNDDRRIDYIHPPRIVYQSTVIASPPPPVRLISTDFDKNLPEIYCSTDGKLTEVLFG